MTKELTQQELIKVFSAYLPYDLQIEFKRNIYPRSIEIQTLDLRNFDLWLNPAKRNSFLIKPILWDLSMLTKEIEHEGNMIIAIDYISTSKSNSQRIMRRVANSQSLDCLEQWQFERLLELHFNVFNLDDSQYINKATLKNQ